MYRAFPAIAEYPEEEALQNEWKAFITSIKMEKPTPIPGDYGLHMVGIVDAAGQSSKLKREIMLKDIENPDLK